MTQRREPRITGFDTRSLNVADGSVASVRGSWEQSSGSHVLATASLVHKAGDERQVCVRSGRPPQRHLNAGFLSLPTSTFRIRAAAVSLLQSFILRKRA